MGLCGLGFGGSRACKRNPGSSFGMPMYLRGLIVNAGPPCRLWLLQAFGSCGCLNSGKCMLKGLQDVMLMQLLSLVLNICFVVSFEES